MCATADRSDILRTAEMYRKAAAVLRTTDASSPQSRASRRKLLLGLLAAPMCLSAVELSQPTTGYAAPAVNPGDLIFANGDDTVSVIDINTGRTSSISSGYPLGGAAAVVSASDGSAYLADQRYQPDRLTDIPAILRLDVATGAIRVVTSGGFDVLGGMAIDRDDSLVVVDRDARRIVRINPVNGSRTTIASGGMLYRPLGAAKEADGSIVVTADTSGASIDGPRRIVRVRRTTGRQEIVSEGGSLTRPESIVVGSSGTIYVTDAGSPSRILGIDPQTGAQRLVYQNPSSRGYLNALAIDQYDLLYMAFGFALGDTSEAGFARVDPRTGAFAVMSRDPLIQSFIIGLTVQRAPTAVPCPVRSPVSVRGTNLGGGRLQVNVTATGNPNYIRSLTYGQVANAAPERAAVISGATAEFVLKRTGPGVTFPFTMADACGDWKTFVVGGPNAF
jgi:streptogramin lyase